MGHSPTSTSFPFSSKNPGNNHYRRSSAFSISGCTCFFNFGIFSNNLFNSGSRVGTSTFWGRPHLLRRRVLLHLFNVGVFQVRLRLFYFGMRVHGLLHFGQALALWKVGDVLAHCSNRRILTHGFHIGVFQQGQGLGAEFGAIFHDLLYC